MPKTKSVLFIGGGAFGSALTGLVRQNGYDPGVVEIGEVATECYDVVVIAVPVVAYRDALLKNSIAFSHSTIVVSCSKGIEQETACLPHQIFAECSLPGRYHTLSGPSFAREIVEERLTVVDCAGVGETLGEDIRALFGRPYFKLEEHDSVFEIELAGAIKNVYAIAAGFIAGCGGGANTQAHLQVAALREYQGLARALMHDVDVVRPSIVGDLLLTCGSQESRNFRYGFERAQGGDLPGVTVEGVKTVVSLRILEERTGVKLPLARAVGEVVERGQSARESVLRAIGF